MVKKINILLVCTMIAMMLFSVCNVVLADGPEDIKGKIQTTKEFDTIGGKIIGGIQSIGTIISIGVLVVLGIKYMLGSTEEKAEYKKTMIPYLIGAVLIFAAANIASMVYNFAGTVG